MNGNGWFFVGALVGIVVTVVFEVFVGFIFDLPSRGVDDDAPSASDVVERHTGNVRVVAPAEYPHGQVIDLREMKPPKGYRPEMPAGFKDPRDADNTTVGHALGAVLVLAAFLLLLGLAGGIEGGAL